MYAVISTGGKQYKVREGQVVRVEKLAAEPGAKIDLETLLVAGEDGSGLKLGRPSVSGTKVAATVVEHGRADKIQVVKYKPKSRYKRVNGHRQPFTAVRIEKIA